MGRNGTLLRRNWLVAWWQARSAVGAGISLAQYLRNQVAQYVLALGRRGMHLALEVSLRDDELVLRYVSPPIRPRPMAEAERTSDTWESELARRHGPEALGELATSKAKAARLDEQTADARDELEKRRVELASALAAGQAAPAGERQAVAHLRPSVPGRISGLLSIAAASVLVLAEAWQLAIPFLNAGGIDASALWPEMARAPLQVFLGFAFAAGSAGLLLALAHVALDRAKSTSSDDYVCSPSERIAAFDRWALDAIRKPRSSFSI